MKNIKKLRRHIGAFLAMLLLCQQFAGIKTYAGDGNEPACGSKVYEYDGYTVEYNVAASWSGAYNAVITITNTGSETIHNWGFVMETSDTISGLYNAEELSNNDGIRLIKNAGYNQDIPAGGNITLGYTASYETAASLPDKFALAGMEKQVELEDCTVSLLLNDEWEKGGIAQLIIENTGDEPIEDWMLEFDSALDIADIWGAVIEKHEGEHYFLRNPEYAQNISTGESATVGIVFTGAAADFRDVEVKKIVVSDKIDNSGDKSDDDPKENAGDDNNDEVLYISKEHMSLNEDGDYELDDEFSMFSGKLAKADEVDAFTMCVYDKNDILIYEANITPEEQWSNSDFAFIFGLNRVVFEVSLKEYTYSEELTVDCMDDYNFDKLNLDLEDSDGDGVANYYESYFGTDINKIDTDDDGLTDFQELHDLWYDPLSADTDDNGIPDCNEDRDGDGISNKAEYDMGSDPVSLDSDGDSLPDSIEIVYGTSLIIEDTDGDGLTDYEEYQLDEMNASYDDSKNEYTADFTADDMGSAYDAAVIPALTLHGDAQAILNFSMALHDDDYCLNSTMVGYLGQAYDFTTEGNMSGAELTFSYDESLLSQDMLNDPDFHPAIYYFDPEEHNLTELADQTWTGNKVTAHLEHFSTYILVNKAAYDKFRSRNLNSILSELGYSGIAYGGVPGSVSGTVGTDAEIGKIILSVTDQAGNPVSDADVIICCTSSFGRYGVWVLLYDGVDPNKLLVKAKTDTEGKLVCSLDPGSYTILVDKNNTSGAAVSIGEFYGERFHDELQAGEERELKAILAPYPQKNSGALLPTPEELKGPKLELCVYNETRSKILYSYKVRLYRGWGLNNFSDPVVERQSPPSAFFNEVFAIEVAKGCYTVEIEKEGYPNKYMEVLVDEGISRPFLAVMGVEDVASGKIQFDENRDGLDDRLTELICRGLITTETGTTVFAKEIDDPNWEEIYNKVMENNDYDGDLLLNGEEIRMDFINEMAYIKMRSVPDEYDTDKDGVNDKEDPNPMLPDEITVNLANVYTGMDYLDIENLDGGNQSWWGIFSNGSEEGHAIWNRLTDYMLFERIENYRIAKLGCGLIAMTDLELYLTQQNDGYHLIGDGINYDKASGHISQYEYMKRANYNEDHSYFIDASIVNFIGGVVPPAMEKGIEEYLNENGSSYNRAKWAPTSNKDKLIDKIETMISNGLPVVLSYHRPKDPLRMYISLERAIEDPAKDNESIKPDKSCKDHYMTVVGYSNYLKDNGNGYGHILKVVSWGKVYYINYEQYSEQINYCTNILEIRSNNGNTGMVPVYLK